MAWVKGELLSDIDSASLDPTCQLSRQAQPCLFDRLDWFSRTARHAAPGGQPLIARAASEGALAWLFLVRRDRRSFEALTNWYAMAFRPVFAGDPDDARRLAMLTAIAKRLRSMRRGPSRINMRYVPRADGSAVVLSRAFRRAGWAVFGRQVSTSWTADVRGADFETYWAQRPGQLRNTYKRRSSKADFDVRVYDQFDDAIWDEFESVYADSWKPTEGAPDFLRETAKFEGDAGCLRLGICRLDGVAIAAQFWTVENGVAYIHKLAYRTSARELSPGTILSVALFRHVIDQDHVDTIDFGTGDDGYKADWMDSSAPLDQITAYNPRHLGGWAGAAREIAAALVRRVRQG